MRRGGGGGGERTRGGPEDEARVCTLHTCKLG